MRAWLKSLVVGTGLMSLFGVTVYTNVEAKTVLPTPDLLSGGDECVDTEAAVKENPNKMLFISCGGFLE